MNCEQNAWRKEKNTKFLEKNWRENAILDKHTNGRTLLIRILEKYNVFLTDFSCPRIAFRSEFLWTRQ